MPGTTNATGDPRFVNPAQTNYHLLADSPAIDAGDPAATVAMDIDADPRPQGDANDVGADEVLP